MLDQTSQLPAPHLLALRPSHLRCAAADGSDLVAEGRHRDQQLVVFVEDTAAGSLIQTQQALAAQHVQGEACGDTNNQNLKKKNAAGTINLVGKCYTKYVCYRFMSLNMIQSFKLIVF